MVILKPSCRGSSVELPFNLVQLRNNWRQIRGPLTGEMVRIPDVNSGYPKGVYPTKWQDGHALGVALFEHP